MPWVPDLDIDFHLGVDGISYPLVVLTGLLTLLCCAYTVWKVPEGGCGRTLAALLLVLEVGILGTFLALDLVLFFVFFEVVLLPMYAVIAGWGGPDRRAAARKFVLYTLVGSVLLLLGVLRRGRRGRHRRPDRAGRRRPGSPATPSTLAFALFAVAFAVKAPLWPLHTWLPDAHTEAPTVGSVILAGVLLKMGTYGLIRVGVGVAPQGAAWAAPVLGHPRRRRDHRRLAGVPAADRAQAPDRLLQRRPHGLRPARHRHADRDRPAGGADRQRGPRRHHRPAVLPGRGDQGPRAHRRPRPTSAGCARPRPGWPACSAFAAIASLGLPGLAGFWGEAFAVVAAVERGGPLWITLAVVAAIGGALTAAYFLRLLRRVTHGPATPAVTGLPGDRPRRVAGVVARWSCSTLAVGLVPALVLAAASDPVAALIGVLR